MASDLNRSAYLVLGMISAGYTTGYEISKWAELAGRFFWAAGDGQVYPQLKKLEAGGLIESQTEHQGKRTRRRYALTADGEAALGAWLRSSSAPMFELRHEGLLQLFFSGDLTVGEVVARLDVIKRVHESVVARLEEVGELAKDQPAALLTQRFGLAVHGATIDWCENTTALLQTADPDAQAAQALAGLADRL